MSLIDFPNPPLTIGQTFAASNGATYEWDGEVWTAPLTPGSGGGGTANPVGPAGGDLGGSFPNPVVLKASTGLTVPVNADAVVMGSAVPKSRLSWSTNPVGAQWRVNVNTANVIDDPTRWAWGVSVEPQTTALGTRIAFYSAPPAATVSLWSMPFWFDALGYMGIAAFSGNAVVMGGQSTKARLLCGADVATNGIVSLRTNRDYADFVDDVALPSWKLNMGGQTGSWDFFDIARSPAATTAVWQTLLRLTSDGDLTTSGFTHFIGQRGSIESDTHALNLWGNNTDAPGYLSALHTWKVSLDYENDFYDIKRDGVELLKLDATGKLTIGAMVGASSVLLGTTVPKSRVQSDNTIAQGFGSWSVNQDVVAGIQDDVNLPSWQTTMRTDGGSGVEGFRIDRIPPGGTPWTVLRLTSQGYLWVSSVSGNPCTLRLTAYTNNSPQMTGIAGFNYRGTSAAPLPMLLNDQLLSITSTACYTAGGATSTGATIRFVTTEDWSSSAKGTKFEVYTIPTGTVTQNAKFTFDGLGDITISGPNATKSAGTSWINPSDIRIKRNVVDYDRGLDEILKLRPVMFAHNGRAGTTDGNVGWGYLADEVLPVMPECIGSMSAKLDVGDEKEVEIQTLDVSNISLAMVNAIKELAARVTALEGVPT